MAGRLERNPKLKNLANHLRKNATKEENRLWYEFLRTYKIKFHRQRIIGNYIADFFCPKVMLVIKLDGSQHFMDKGIEKDAERTEFLNTLGITVLRFTNNEIKKNFSSVCFAIDKEVERLEKESLLPCGEGGTEISRDG